ncbi:hypothetical protein [Marinobacter sp.]|uniref:hypothetical protein n=1 Tax=Marinobacter sp. TaxID=50741 RepID=UPI00257A0D2E|nr:hypothetical protein [Marinobacter sp.]|tara:strand:- start:279 stop:740 length:462 start_codon:yes stop_codon:yes gene_type:complete
MSYKYTIVQENTANKTKMSYEFAAQGEDDLVEELNVFMSSIGFANSGYLAFVEDEDIIDDVDSESESIYSTFNSDVNPDVETYRNFEFPISSYDEAGQGQVDYNYTSDYEQTYNGYDLYSSSQATFPFPMDRPSQATYRVDSFDTANVQYYGA